MKFKFLQAAVVGLMLSVCNIANAGLINIKTGSFDLLSGAETLNIGDLIVTLVPPLRVKNVTDDFSTLFINSSSYTLDNISTTGGSFSFSEFWDFSNGITPLNLTLFTDYVVDSWLNNLSLTAINGDGITDILNISGTSQLTDGIDSLNLSFIGAVTNYVKYGTGGANDIYYTGFNGTFSISNNGSPTSVPEPSTLAIFALGIMGLASRRFKKQ